MERKFVESYAGFADITLENLRVMPDLNKTINPFKVVGISHEMCQRPDPSLICLTVAPDPAYHEPNLPTDNSESGEKSAPPDSNSHNKVDETFQHSAEEVPKHYVAIGGLHTLTALKSMKTKGKTVELNRLLSNEMVPCVIVNTNDKDILIYGNARCKELESKFISKPRSQDLLKIYENYLDKPEHGKKVIKRMLKIQDVHQSEQAAILRFIEWGKAPFLTLRQVFGLYETYETLDVMEKSSGSGANNKRLAKGETKKISGKLLVGISNMDPEDFMKKAAAVIYQEVTLKSLIEKDSLISSSQIDSEEINIPDVSIIEKPQVCFDELSNLDLLVKLLRIYTAQLKNSLIFLHLDSNVF